MSKAVEADCKKEYPLVEEIANALTHGLGAVLSIIGLILLVVYASFGRDAWTITSVAVFGSTLILVYLASTLYHALPWREVKRYMRIVDHCAIYCLIAGTYTPFLLTEMRGPWGWSLFGVLWGAALAGCIFKLFFIGRFHLISTLLYVAMGWTVIVAIKPTLEAVPMGAMWLMLAGGLAYTTGVLFYLWERLPFSHAVWHLFVMAGSGFHFAAVFWYIARGEVA